MVQRPGSHLDEGVSAKIFGCDFRNTLSMPEGYAQYLVRPEAGHMLSDWGLGSLIGFERDRLLWAAGIRTHMLICGGACLIMIVSAFGFSDIMRLG